MLLTASRAIDWLKERFGAVATWPVLLSNLISAGNAGTLRIQLRR